MADFVWFEADFPGAKCSSKLQSPQPGEVGILLLTARRIAGDKMYDCAPIDRASIEKAAAKRGKISDMAKLREVLAAEQPGKLEAELAPFVKLEPITDKNAKSEPNKKEIAVDYFLHCLFRQVFPQTVKCSGTPKKGEFRLAANMKDWTLVKKINLAAASKDEVFAGLVGIADACLRKEPYFTCNAPDAFDAYSNQFLSQFSQRKSFGKIADILSKVDEVETKKTLCSLCLNQNHMTSACLMELFYLRIFAFCGYSPYVPLALINDAYPALKIPKPRGNYGRKKKKG